MKRVLLILILGAFLFPLASAEILITTQPNDIYNLGEVIDIPVKVSTLQNIEELFTMKLLCNGIETEVYREYLILSTGEEVSRNPSIPLIGSFIGRSTGTCRIKATLGEEIKLTDEFKISNEIKITLKNNQTEFAPEEEIPVEFEATKQGKKPVNGFVNITVEGTTQTDEIEILDIVTNGYSYTAFSMPKETRADQYLVSVNVYEKDVKGAITNKGFSNYNIKIKQVPTSLEIVMGEKTVEPGTDAVIRTTLHDQTGEKIDSSSLITVENSNGEILAREEVSTEDSLKIPTLYKEPPATWSVFAVSNGIEAETTFEIEEKASVKTEIINKTLKVTNVGNIQYNNTIQVNIGDITLPLDIELGVGEEATYVITAPNGEYNVEITTGEGESQVSENVPLTGNAVSIKKSAEGVSKIIRHPVSWLFILVILGLGAFVLFRKGYNKKFFAYMTRKKEQAKPILPLKQSSILKTKNKAKLSLSIKGDKQNIDLICLRIKNLKDLDSKKSPTSDTLQKIVTIAEENKTYIYESNDSIFFLFVPSITKTFKNKEKAVKLAQQIKELLEENNKSFKQKIEFGISLNSGAIISKLNQNVLEFMGMGTLVTEAKKIAKMSDKTIFLSEKIRANLPSGIKLEKHSKDDLTVYTIKEIRNTEDNKKFIRNFLDRIEGKANSNSQNSNKKTM